jgi:hypothetical protein
MGQAGVSMQDGLPCFAVGENLATQGIHAVTVYDSSTAPPKMVWTVFAALDKTLSASPDRCVPYGKAFDSSQIRLENSKAAQPLTAGTVYEVVVMSPPQDPTDPTRGFRAKFCLRNLAGAQGFSLYPVEWDKKQSRWNDDACKQAPVSKVNGEIVSSIYTRSAQVYTLRFSIKENSLRIEGPHQTAWVEKLQPNASPLIVGADQYLRLLPLELQPYLAQNKLLYMSSERSRVGDGRGYCGGGLEVFLASVDIGAQRIRPHSRVLVTSCLESIAMGGLDDFAGKLNALTVVNGRLQINFAVSKDQPDNANAFLATDLKSLEFTKP